MKNGVLTFMALGALAFIAIIGFKVGQSFKTSEITDYQTSKVEPTIPASDNSDEIYTVVEQMPEFPGGPMEMMKFISSHINYPLMAKDAGLEGRVVIGFVVDKYGYIKNPEIKRDIGLGCGEEALRVVRNMPNWLPGRQKGETVDVSFNLPVRFKLE